MPDYSALVPALLVATFAHAATPEQLMAQLYSDDNAVRVRAANSLAKLPVAQRYALLDLEHWPYAKKPALDKNLNQALYHVVNLAAGLARAESDVAKPLAKRCPDSSCDAKFFLFTIANKGFGVGLPEVDDPSMPQEAVVSHAKELLDEVLLPPEGRSFAQATAAAHHSTAGNASFEWRITTNCTEGGIYEVCAFRNDVFDAQTHALLFTHPVPIDAKDNYGIHLDNAQAGPTPLWWAPGLVAVFSAGGCCGSESQQLYVYGFDQGFDFLCEVTDPKGTLDLKHRFRALVKVDLPNRTCTASPGLTVRAALR